MAAPKRRSGHAGAPDRDAASFDPARRATRMKLGDATTTLLGGQFLVMVRDAPGRDGSEWTALHQETVALNTSAPTHVKLMADVLADEYGMTLRELMSQLLQAELENADSGVRGAYAARMAERGVPVRFDSPGDEQR